jgi:DNA-binding transcriptional regulator YhcF (GntR family)
MTSLQPIPLGVPRFKKLPKDPAIKYSASVSSQNQIPNFQKLPPFVPKDYNIAIEPIAEASDSLPRVDLKGHSIEELAAMANVNVETIKAAMKLRQQQIIREKNQPITPPSRGLETPITKRITTSTSASTTTTAAATTPFVQTERVTEVSTTNTPAPVIVKKTSPPIKYTKKPLHKMTSSASYKVVTIFTFLISMSKYLTIVYIR